MKILQGGKLPLNIKDDATHEAARVLARARDTTITEAVSQAIHEALERERMDRDRHVKDLAGALDEIAIHCASLPLLDARSPEEILGYDDDGVPG